MSGYDTLKKTVEDIKAGRSPRRKSIDDMTLLEALEAKEKYLQWAEKNQDNDEYENKKYLFNNYLLPHIDKLQQQELDLQRNIQVLVE